MRFYGVLCTYRSSVVWFRDGGIADAGWDVVAEWVQRVSSGARRMGDIALFSLLTPYRDGFTGKRCEIVKQQMKNEERAGVMMMTNA